MVNKKRNCNIKRGRARPDTREVAKYTDEVGAGDTWQGKEMLYLNTEGIRGGRGHIGVAHRTI